MGTPPAIPPTVGECLQQVPAPDAMTRVGCGSRNAQLKAAGCPRGRPNTPSCALSPPPSRPAGTRSNPTRSERPVLSRRREPPRRVNYSWGAWAYSQDLLCPRLLRRSGEKTGEKFPEQSWSHFLFSQVSIEHLLDAWPLEWGCNGGGREKREVLVGPQEFPLETMRRSLTLRTRSPGRRKAWILSPLLSSFPFPSSRLHLLGSTPSPHQFLPHFPALPGFSLEGPFSQRGADAEPHCLSPNDCSLPGTGPATPHPSPKPGGLGL
ncbi:uncharacterized protein LOC124976038 [Sciurus carolinensis]|uniref:uncharacterized protein LOC124976038 n=1 Tax=Sciurus carolinensis TaxID=30640 RepID=UPI001FB310E0|nr:uncharacterized protein LOC124976038 [Sciurus carolinensis]